MRLRFGKRAAFTFVELCFVIVVLGALTLIAVPRIREAKRKAQRARVVITLKNLVTTQEAYWNQYDKYASALTDLPFEYNPGIDVTIVFASTSGWSAKAVEDIFSQECAVFYGKAPALAPAKNNSEIGCAP